MKVIQRYLNSRLFFYSQGQFFQIGVNGFIKVEPEVFINTNLPMVIVGREHLTETVKQYPITDKTDLKAIVKQEKKPYSMQSSPVVLENQSIVKLWHPDPDIFEQLRHKFLLWLPESLLLSYLSTNELFQVQRCGLNIFTFNDSTTNYSAVCKGAFTSANYFLMSVGAASEAQQKVNEAQYSHLLLEQIYKLRQQDVIRICEAQEFLTKTKEGFNWPSIATGAVAGAALYYASILGILSVQEAQLESHIASQEISAAINKKHEIIRKREIFAEFAGQDVSQNFELQMWHFFGEVMKERISIIKVRTEEEGIWIRLQSKVATESLNYIKSLPMIKSAKFANAVQNFRGEQRFNLNVTFQEIERRDSSEQQQVASSEGNANG